MYIYCTYIKTGVWHIVCPDDLLSGSARTEDACGKKTIKKEKKKKESYKNQEFIIIIHTSIPAIWVPVVRREWTI